MCGITGVLVKGRNTKSNLQRTSAMLNALEHRGSDHKSSYSFTDQLSNSTTTIGHARLAINDLSENGNQPFQLEKTSIVVNGEIWNHKELRKYLKRKGFTFKSKSDCEVILPLYALGELTKLDGMFSFIIIDKEKKQMVVSRDWVGKLPLYMAKTSETIMLASEIKALRVGQGNNITDEIKFVPRNSLIIIDLETLKMNTFKNFYGWIGNSEHLISGDVASNTYRLLDEAVKKRTISDVPIATLNSGGIDSSVITYLLSQYVKDIKCYTVKFDEDSPDLKHARLLAEKVGIPLVEVEVPKDPDIIKQRFLDVCRTIEYPSNVQVQVGIMLSFVGEQLAKDGYKVVFSGEGSDESAGSYGNYRMWSKKPDWTDVKKQMFEKQYYGNLLRGNNIFMQYGTIECRTPFFDRDYVGYVCNLPCDATTGKGKQWKQHLADAFRGKIPDEIIDRPKEAFQKGTCFKDWFEELIINDPDINKKGRKKMHHVIMDTIHGQLGYNIRDSRRFEFATQHRDIGDMFE
jgi:asparagine synthase (glutamine-hydrolysing)